MAHRVDQIHPEPPVRGQSTQRPECRRFADLSAARLQESSAREGLDAATAALYEQVVCSRKHGPFIRRIEELRRQTESSPSLDNLTFAVAPGAFYREFPHIEADGRLLRSVAAELGCRTALIPVPSSGPLRSNARIIVEWLHQQEDRPIVLASLSKGGADVKIALREPDAAAAFRRVVAWINLCGMVQGTPLVPALLARPLRTALVRCLFWCRRLDFQMVRDLDGRPGAMLAGELRLPEHLRLVSIIGFPLQCHMTNRRSRMWRRVLEPFGPNDGGVLLRDVCALPGLLYPVWGADHYLSPKHVDVRALARAILLYLSEELNLLREKSAEGRLPSLQENRL